MAATVHIAMTMLGPPGLGRPGRGKSGATLAFEALRRLAAEARANPAANWRLSVAPEVAAALRGPTAAALAALEHRLGRRIAVAPLAGSEPRDTRSFDIAVL